MTFADLIDDVDTIGDLGADLEATRAALARARVDSHSKVALAKAELERERQARQAAEARCADLQREIEFTQLRSRLEHIFSEEQPPLGSASAGLRTPLVEKKKRNTLVGPRAASAHSASARVSRLRQTWSAARRRAG